jgi:hypothetical protein
LLLFCELEIFALISIFSFSFSFLQITASLSLMRRLPPNKIEQNLNGLLNLLPDETDELLQRVDQPLKEDTDSTTVIILFSRFSHFSQLI